MLPALMVAAFLMGLAGGPHCAAMCGPACGGVVRVVRPGAAQRAGATLRFHAGRVFGYAVAGAAAAHAVQGVGWLSEQTAALRPLWTLLHAAVLAWGLALLVLGRQPACVGAAGRQAWARLRPLAPRLGGSFTVGMLWAFMPCGLLYSALLAAALSGGPLAGALSMALFALGSAVSLAAGPLLFERLLARGDRSGADWGTRAGGALVVLASVWALWADLAHRVAAWCGLA